MARQSNLAKKAMLVSLGTASWSGRKHDKKVSEEVAQQHNSDVDMGRFSKKLMPKEAPSLKAVTSILSRAREEHYRQTLPWSDEGCRLLPASNYMEYAAKVRQFQAELAAALPQFVKDYPKLKKEAKKALNGLFNEDDYPSPDEIAERFALVVKFYPLPDAADFRVTLADDEVEEIRRQIEEDTNMSVLEAVDDLYGRLADAVDHIVNRLATPDAKFKNTLISNLQEVVDLVPRLNLTGDKRLATLTKRIQSELLKVEPQQLREDETLRAEVAEKAKAIQSDFEAYFSIPLVPEKEEVRDAA
ncbi:MAG TPA: hypothetical protein VEF04_17945 [Blastocatellia bacterium]|nr:hypothetical protein [Blastocatellia bacterium]